MPLQASHLQLHSFAGEHMTQNSANGSHQRWTHGNLLKRIQRRFGGTWPKKGRYGIEACRKALEPTHEMQTGLIAQSRVYTDSLHGGC